MDIYLNNNNFNNNINNINNNNFEMIKTTITVTKSNQFSKKITHTYTNTHNTHTYL